MKKKDFKRLSVTMIENRKSTPEFLYNSGICIEEPHSVSFLSEKKESKEPELVNRKSISCLFNTNTVFEDNSIAFDVFSEEFLRENNNKPKCYFELVPIIIRREIGYPYRQNRDGLVSKSVIDDKKKKRRWEEHEERAFYNYFNDNRPTKENEISIIDYEMPLKVGNKREEKLKSVDVIGLSSDKKISYLLELKSVESGETLVRSSLEIYTYYSRLGLNRTETRRGIIERLKKDYKPLMDMVEDIRPGLLLINGGNQYKDYSKIKEDNEYCKNVKKLIEGLELDVFVVNKYNKYGEIIPFISEQDVIVYQKTNNKSRVKPIVRLANDEKLKIEKVN